MMNHVNRPTKKLRSSAKKIGELLAATLEKDPHFYFFSPDETTSNKFDQVFTVEKRAWGSLPREAWDLPESVDGRIIEMLSENVLFSLMTGHLSNGEKAMMGSYEAFYPIIASQLLQQIKFIKQSKLVKWRIPIPAVNLLSTSTCWRQDHNGFTHQSPALISMLLSNPSNLSNCFFPLDDVSTETVFDKMINSYDVVNLTTFDKNERPRYLSQQQASALFQNGGAIILDNYSDKNPDIILATCGDVVAHEGIRAIDVIKRDLPNLKIRFVYIGALSYQAIGLTSNKLSEKTFETIFGLEQPIVANFHGYADTLLCILSHYTTRNRLHVHGFSEEGSTTTPCEMLRRNAVSRYDLAIDMATELERPDLVAKYKNCLVNNHIHAIKYCEDDKAIFD